AGTAGDAARVAAGAGARDDGAIATRAAAAAATTLHANNIAAVAAAAPNERRAVVERGSASAVAVEAAATTTGACSAAVAAVLPVGTARRTAGATGRARREAKWGIKRTCSTTRAASLRPLLSRPRACRLRPNSRCCGSLPLRRPARRRRSRPRHLPPGPARRKAQTARLPGPTWRRRAAPAAARGRVLAPARPKS